MLLALIAWIGGLIFFSFVLAPTVFTVLPSREMAGNVVSRSLTSSPLTLDCVSCAAR
jgi:uncharacterized membrane protein